MFRRFILTPLTLALCVAAAPDALAADLAGAAETVEATETLAAPHSEAMEAFKTRHEAVLRLVKSGAADDKIQAEIDHLLDYNYVAQAALGGPTRYAKKCEPRCPEFEELLRRLITQNYLKRVRQANTGKLEYVGEDVRKKATKVNTKVIFTKNGKKQELNISYVMYEVEKGKWICRSVITDGVRLDKTWRYEFSKILREGGIDLLIAKLENKLAELAKAQ